MSPPVPLPPAITVAQKRNRYWRGQVWPRRRELFLSWRFWVPLLTGLIVSFTVSATTTVRLPIQELATVGINYSALSFGACVTGSVLAIGLPSEDRVRRWARQRSSETGYSQYSKLVFALTWAALAQLQILLVAIVAVVIGEGVDVVPDEPFLSHRLLLGLALGSFLYAALQLLILVSTVSQLGNVIDFEAAISEDVRH